MSEHFILIETTTRQQINERIAEAASRRLARRVAGSRGHRGLRRRGDRLEN